MKILEAEEAADILPLRRSRETRVSAMLKQLKVGQALVVETKDWKTKGTPYRVASRIAKSSNRRFEKGRMPDGSGWIFKRME